jgi:NADH-quinone oxidoreductase subunit M
MFPVASHQMTPWIVALSLVGIVYGALVADGAAGPEEARRVFVGQPPRVLHARLYAMNSQGFAGLDDADAESRRVTGALFLLVGVVYERRHTRMIADFGGLWKRLPVYASVFLA